MSQQDIRLPNGRRIGSIETLANGDMVGRLESGHQVGKYEAKTNKTRLPSGREYGSGNLLSALIMQEQK